MSLLADALQPLYVRGIFSTSRSAESVSVPDLITDIRSAYNLTVHSDRSIELDFVDYHRITESIAHDCKRLSISSLQTLIVPPNEDQEKLDLPWTIIRLYYASFYASHVISRLLGHGCCYLDTSHVVHLEDYCRALSIAPGFPITRGSYSCKVDASGSRLTLKRIDAGGGGAHEALWHTMDALLKKASEDVLNGQMLTRDAQAVSLKIDAFRALAARTGTTNWLSRIRNGIQYRLEHEVWHATNIVKRDRIALAKLASNWKQDPMGIKLDPPPHLGGLGAFVTACIFLLSLHRSLIIRVEERSSNQSGCFVRNGPRALANLAQVAM